MIPTFNWASLICPLPMWQLYKGRVFDPWRLVRVVKKGSTLLHSLEQFHMPPTNPCNPLAILGLSLLWPCDGFIGPRPFNPTRLGKKKNCAACPLPIPTNPSPCVLPFFCLGWFFSPLKIKTWVHNSFFFTWMNFQFIENQKMGRESWPEANHEGAQTNQGWGRPKRAHRQGTALPFLQWVNCTSVDPAMVFPLQRAREPTLNATLMLVMDGPWKRGPSYENLQTIGHKLQNEEGKNEEAAGRGRDG